MAAAWRYADALKALLGGGVIAYPTEAVWGLGCDPDNAAAVQHLLAIKKRPADKGLILVASQAEQLGCLLDALDTSAIARLQAPTDVPTTWLLPHGDAVSPWITGRHATVAVRISSHPVIGGLCNAFGGMLVSTSANPASRAPARSQLRARRYFSGAVDCYVPGPLGSAHRPSQIRDLITGHLLRA
mgnify:CR=1 FL=1